MDTFCIAASFYYFPLSFSVFGLTSGNFLHQEMITAQPLQNQNVSHQKTYMCGFCGKNCITPSSLDMHLLTHTGERPFTCSICNTSFRQKVHLTRHLTIHTGEKPYKCDACGKTFARKDRCQEHFRSHHIIN